jgi:ABC-type sugar transport system ATPase subunit
LLDEPLANVDPTLRARLRNDILDVSREIGATLIYVTHDHFEAMLMGDLIAVLSQGGIQQLARPGELYDFPANLWVARFIGFPPMNIFHGLLLRRKADVYFEVTSSASSTTAASTRSRTPAEADGEADQVLAHKTSSRANDTGVASGLTGPDNVHRDQALAATPDPPVSFRLDSVLIPGWERFLSKPILVGLRPEQINCVQADSMADDSSVVRATIDSVTRMGADTFLMVSHGPLSFVARVGSKGTFAAGEQCAFSFSMQHASLFDPLTGQALHRPCAS